MYKACMRTLRIMFVGVQKILTIRKVLPLDQAKDLDTGQHLEQLWTLINFMSKINTMICNNMKVNYVEVNVVV